MKAAADTLVAVCAALGLHVAAFAVVPQMEAFGGAGDDGVDLIALEDANDAMAALVDSWDAPPAFAPLPQLDTPEAPDDAQSLDVIRFSSATGVENALSHPSVLGLPPAPDLPAMAATDVPMPPVAADPAPRPKARPEAPAKPTPAPAAGTAEKAAPDGNVAPARNAAGEGGGAVAGNRGTAKTLSKAAAADLKASWGATIRARVERRKSYPAAAEGATGKVTVRLTVRRDGALSGVTVAKSSGNAALDAAAVRAVKAAATFPAAPDGLTDARYSFTLPMSFAR